MRELFTGIEYRVSSGDYNIKVITTGTAVLQYRVLNESFTTITGVDYTSNADGTIELPSCTVKPTLTGDAVMYLTKIKGK